jgi:hypothetical protein
MTTNKHVLAAALAGVLGVTANSAQAALVNGSVLSFTGTYGAEVAPGFVLPTSISSFNGLVIGAAQPASGSHSGPIDGSESPGIDNPWQFAGNTGMHLTTSPVNILSDDGAGNVTLDFSGWAMTWNGVPVIPLGTGAWEGNPEGEAILTCANTCEDGDSYSLDYSATVPEGDPSGFGTVRFNLDLSGTITAPVPLPAAAWLFGSGLVGLMGVAWKGRKRRH